jgi:hypothetical protein
MADFWENKSERPKATVLQKAGRKKFPIKYSKTKIICTVIINNNTNIIIIA